VFAELSQNIDLVSSSSSRLKKRGRKKYKIQENVVTGKGEMVFCFQNYSDKELFW
jgi:hypothetical protein